MATRRDSRPKTRKRPDRPERRQFAVRPAPHRLLTGLRGEYAAPPPSPPLSRACAWIPPLSLRVVGLGPSYVRASCRPAYNSGVRTRKACKREFNIPIDRQDKQVVTGTGSGCFLGQSPAGPATSHSVAYPCHASLSWLGLPIDKGRAAMRPEPVPTVSEPPRQVRTMQAVPPTPNVRAEASS